MKTLSPRKIKQMADEVTTLGIALDKKRRILVKAIAASMEAGMEYKIGMVLAPQPKKK